MPDSVSDKSLQPNKLIFYFLVGWTILNAIQASTLELQGDEAYYWLYSRYLDWGYFDHPPMVAIFIRIGDSLMHTELGLRLLTVLASTGSIYLLWLILKKYAVDPIAFILVISGVFIFHIYGFTTTPDAPLFFFTVLFYYLYQQYTAEDKWLLALLLGITIACMLYSKYNAVLVVGFTLLSDTRLTRRWSFWGIVFLATVLYIPHLLWQTQHGFPSVNYHLFERSADHYDFTNTFSYLPGQLLMAGPLIGWFLFCKAFTTKSTDSFIRCLKINCIYTLVFFFFSSSKGEVQPQWTFILFAPLVMLALIKFTQTGIIPKWFYPLAITNLTIILLVRIIVIFGFGFARTYGHLKSYYGFKEWAQIVKQKAGDNYVVMSEGFQNPSKYNYYTNSLKCFAYDNWYYRHTQFDIWPMEDSLQHKRVYYLFYQPVKGLTTDSVKVAAGTWYDGWVNDVRTYQKVLVECEFDQVNIRSGDHTTLELTITNPYDHTISFDNTGQTHAVALMAYIVKGEEVIDAQKADSLFNKIKLKPGESASYTFPLIAPLKKGKFKLLFSLKTDPFAGSKNSKMIDISIR